MAGDKSAVRKILDAAKAGKRTALTAPEGKLVCDAYGIPVPQEGVASSAADAAKQASAMGFPVVLKIVSPEILHKTEAGGVLVGVKSAQEAENAFATIMANAKQHDAKAKLLYDYLDNSVFFSNAVRKGDRSHMNVTFRLRDETLDAEFLKAARAADIVQIKGHRIVGGMRASIYNAMPLAGVKRLVGVMREFEARHA